MPYRPERKGLAYRGGDMFFIALSTCITNVLIGEAGRRNIPVRHIDVDLEADWGAKDACAESVSLSVEVEADASEEEILNLINWADSDSKITRTTRTGMPVILTSIKGRPSKVVRVEDQK